MPDGVLIEKPLYLVFPAAPAMPFSAVPAGLRRPSLGRKVSL
jgi:hypothetical protein